MAWEELLGHVPWANGAGGHVPHQQRHAEDTALPIPRDLAGSIGGRGAARCGILGQR